MNEIRTSGPLLFTEPDSPTRVGEIINTLSEIYDIPTPRLGMSVYVKDEKRTYIVTELKSKTINGVVVPNAQVGEFELLGEKSIAWGASSNMNNFTTAGVYNIKGERTNANDNLPITNIGENATIAARLIVTVTPEGATTYRHSVGQTLILSNAEGKETKVYTRNGNRTSSDGGVTYTVTWGEWANLQTNVNVGQVTSLDSFIDNGIYSGVWVNNAARVETFVMIVINNYAASTQAGVPKSITQFKHSIAVGGSMPIYETRVGISENDWQPWEEIASKDIISQMISNEISKVIDSAPDAFDTLKEVADWILNDQTGAAAMAKAISENKTAIETEQERAMNAEDGLAEAINMETLARQSSDNDIKMKAALFGMIVTRPNTNSIEIEYKNVAQNATGIVEIPTATTEKAGVMTANDKKRLDDAESIESINWDVENNLDDYTTEGVYNIKGNRVTGDNMPINNEGNITARLNVLVTESNDNKVVTQVLNLNNNQGGEGNVYIRSQQNGTWKPWGKLQTNVEVGQITPDDMSNLTDNGIYSGVCVDGTTIETFVLIVINNYLAATQAGFGAYVSQLKYAIDLNRGNTVKTRTRDAYGIWNDWSSIGGSIELATNKNYGLVRLGTTREGYYPIGNMKDDPELGLGFRLGTETRNLHIVPLVVGTVHDILGWQQLDYNPLGIPIDTSYFNLTDKGLSLRGNIGDSATKVIWDANSNMDNYIEPGIYDIYGERTNRYDRLPITNYGSGHSIAARLTVIDSTKESQTCVTQFLQLSNRMGGEGNIYIRTYNQGNNGSSGWSEWKKQQGMVESYINTDSGTALGTALEDGGLNGMTDNGMYSGVYTDDYLLRAPTFVETFVLVVINDYAVSSQAGTPRRISQLKYATDTLTGQCTVKKRVGTGDDSISWGDWEDVDTRELVEKKDVISAVDDSENPVQSKAIAAAIEEGEKRALRRLFIAAGAEYNDTGTDKTKTAPWGEAVIHKAGHYYLNGLGDITEEQMMEIYNQKDTIPRLWQGGFAESSETVRTYIPITKYRLYDYVADLKLDFAENMSNLESVVFNTLSNSANDFSTMIKISRSIRMFRNCKKLKYVSFINVSEMPSGAPIGLQSCVSLEYVNIIGLKICLSLCDSPLISKRSVKLMIQNASPTSAITITLHPDAYSRLADDAEIVAALEAQPLISLVSA